MHFAEKKFLKKDHAVSGDFFLKIRGVCIISHEKTEKSHPPLSKKNHTSFVLAEILSSKLLKHLKFVWPETRGGFGQKNPEDEKVSKNEKS